MQTMRWGLVPHFSKHDADTGTGALKTINARSEVLIEEARGLWASIKGRKRCAVVCQGCAAACCVPFTPVRSWHEA